MARILLVDDEKSVHSLVAALLSHRGGHRVEGVLSAANALAKLGAARYDLALVDLHMPDLDGEGLVKRMRAAGHATPVVVLSGLPAADVEAAAGRCGAVGWVGKPFEIERLVRAVDAALVPPAPGRGPREA